MLSRDGAMPLYQQLAGAIRARIEQGEWVDGEKLPTERSLCTIYDVSRITVRHAISQLESEGLVRRSQGKGTFVTARQYEQPLSEVHSFEQAMRRLGYSPSTTVHHSGEEHADLLLATALAIEPFAPVISLQLVGAGDDAPIVFYESYFAHGVGARVVAVAQEKSRMGEAFSTLDLYRDALGFPPRQAEQTFEATVASADLAAVLDVREGWPILRVTSIISGPEGPLEFRRASYRGDRYRFVVERDLEAGFIN